MKKRGYPEGSNQKFRRRGSRRKLDDSRLPDVQWRTRIAASQCLIYERFNKKTGLERARGKLRLVSA
ncbi:hypothetical protein DSL72_008256 [Monilinia vaccinii-corymbosi]|uniref:Uncharacterized protein n=1 Tax=Monilinia vaccinii-corymbosi TaxID=61207 RepID=A0A8A3PKH0_9HELO|nr:hypothetical protein DSL72_008256 [Monilinia vaccinii-corymbosi]